MEEHFGPHLLLDAFGCHETSLSSIERVFEFLNFLPDFIGMTKITQPHVFSYTGTNPLDYGVTGSVIIAESHISIHTFPARDGFVTMDVYSCKDFDTKAVEIAFKQFFSPDSIQSQVILRGQGFKR